MCGYTRKVDDGQWQYSRSTVKILREYQERFPEVFDYIATAGNASNDMFHELDVFPGEGGPDRAKELLVWLENLPTHTAPRQPFGTQTLDEPVIRQIEAATDALKTAKRKEVVMQVSDG